MQSNPKSISPSPFNTAKLTLNTSHDSSPPPFSSFNPYFISPSNRCKSPSVTLNPAFTFASAAAAYCPSPSMSHSPRMGIKEANDVWEAQWSPFGRSKTNPAPSPANRPSPHSSSSPVPPRPSSKFHWTYEEGGHERDKGDDSTSEEEEEEERKEVEAPPKPFDFEFDPFAPSSSSTSAPSPRSSLLTTATKYATPHAGHPVLSALTPKTRRPTQSSPVTIFPAPPPSFSTSASPFSLFPVPTISSPPPAPPNSPPLSAAVDPTDRVATTHAPPQMATAATAAVATTGPSPAALAAAALLKQNTAYNKTIAATSEELFRDLETPREWRARSTGEKTVGFADERGKGLAEVHVVPDDLTQYPDTEEEGEGEGEGEVQGHVRVSWRRSKGLVQGSVVCEC